MNKYLLAIVIVIGLAVLVFAARNHPVVPTPLAPAYSITATSTVSDVPVATTTIATTTKSPAEKPVVEKAEQKTAVSSDPYIEQLLSLLNQKRATPLKESAVLDSLATARAKYVCTQQFVESVHGGFATWFGNTTFQWIGENLAQNFDSADTADSALYASPTHKKNIVNPKYSYIGIGHVICPANSFGNKDITVEFFGGYAS